MRSFLAALRSLVLPYGTTSGTRLVLDGVNGRIVIYNAANQAILTMDSATGAITAVNPTDGSQVIINSGDAAEISFVPKPVVGQTFEDGFVYTDEQADGSGVAAYLALQSPTVAGGEPALLFLSGPGPVTMASFIQFISNYWQVYADSIDFNPHNLDTVTFQINGERPRLTAGYQETNTDSGTFTALTTVDSYSPNLVNGRIYEIVWEGQFGSSVAGDAIQVELFQGATSLRRSRLILSRAVDPWPIRLRSSRFTATATGATAFSVKAIRAAGTGNITRYGAAANGGVAVFDVQEVA